MAATPRDAAEVLAALNHPHIAAIYGLEDADGVRALVMELVEGPTLADRIAKGAIPLDEALPIARQIAEALEAAHEQGITHRDLKPANIILTRRGHAKVLDFGLAKIGGPGRDAGDGNNSDVATLLGDVRLTSPGTMLGTVAYMAPEQARGDETDHRTDIFAFGAVLYEMTTGRPAFPGQTPAVIFDAILNTSQVAPRTLNPQVPPMLEDIISRALEKDRARRYQTAADVRADLARLSSDAGPGMKRLIGLSARPGVAAAVAVGALLVSLGAIAALRWVPKPGGGGPIDSIAVLPFVNASGTPDADYLGEGIADTLTNNLAQIGGLRVVPRTLAARYRNQTVDPREAGTTLNARAIVTGRVTQRGDRLSVQVELIDAVGVAQIWGDKFDRPLADVLAIQADISKAIADNLRFRLTLEDERGLTSGAPKDAAAYQLYLKGRHEMYKRTREGYTAATLFFDQAIVRDASYAQAYAGLADVYLWQAYWGYLPSANTYAKALGAANQAVALDDRSAEAHASLGWLNLYYRWDWAESARQYERALALDPSSATIRAWYGESLSARGRHDEAIAEVRRARALDPGSSSILTSLAFVLSNARRFEEAIDTHKMAVERSADSTLAQLNLSRAYRFSGRHDLAIETSRRMADSGDPLGPTFLAASYARAGRTADALSIVRKLEGDAQRSHQGSFLVALAYTALDDRDRAFRWLESAYGEHDTFLPWLKVDPEFEVLHGDPRFDDLVRRIGIPDR